MLQLIKSTLNEKKSLISCKSSRAFKPHFATVRSKFTEKTSLNVQTNVFLWVARLDIQQTPILCVTWCGLVYRFASLFIVTSDYLTHDLMRNEQKSRSDAAAGGSKKFALRTSNKSWTKITLHVVPLHAQSLTKLLLKSTSVNKLSSWTTWNDLELVLMAF